MWRAQTSLAQFPHGWSEPAVVLKADVFEASHTYKVKGKDQYLTLIEAIHSGRRYYAAYTASALDSAWTPLSPSYEKAFASDANVLQPEGKWTENISHGEMLRAGNDEHLEIDLDRSRFLFQGVLEQDESGKPYGLIPWKLGLLELK